VRLLNAHGSSTEKPHFTEAGPKTFTILTAAVVHHSRDPGPRQQLQAAPGQRIPVHHSLRLSRDSAPRGSQPGFPWDDLAHAQSLSAPLQVGFRFLHDPIPAPPSAHLTTRFPQPDKLGGEGFGLTTFRVCTRVGEVSPLRRWCGICAR